MVEGETVAVNVTGSPRFEVPDGLVVKTVLAAMSVPESTNALISGTRRAPRKAEDIDFI